MIELASPRWSELRHAYGSASDIPALLRRLLAGERSGDVQEALHSALWHQGDVFTASYAAVPHLVNAAARMPTEPRLGWLVLAVGIFASSSGPTAPSVPPDLRADLTGAAKDAEPLVSDLLFARQWKVHEARYLLGMVAALQGRPETGLALFDLDAGGTCVSCGADIDLLGLMHLAN